MDFIGIDYGSKSVGLSWGSDDLQIAVPLKSLPLEPIEQFFAQLKQVVLEKGCQGFVLGFPLHLDGTLGKRAQEVKIFAEKLRNFFQLPIYFQDERFSTQSAEGLMVFSGKKTAQKTKKAKQKGIIDAQAAAIILQDFLDGRV